MSDHLMLNRKLLKNFSAILVATVLMMTGSCTDPCKDTTCLNGGTCIDGSCDCPTGYQGDSCKYETRSFFYGTYNVHATCSATGINNYTCNISEVSGDLFKVRIANFANSFSNYVTATINGNLINIASQSPDNDGRIVSGSGSLSGNVIQMSYTVAGGSGTDVCDQSTWTK